MTLPIYKIKINSKWLKGYDENANNGASSHMGWSPQRNDLSMIVLSAKDDEARLIEGNVNLKSEINKIHERIRYADLELNELVITKI